MNACSCRLKERDIVIEDLSEVIQDKEANTCLVRDLDDKTEPFRIEGNLQQKDLLDAFILDDALKHSKRPTHV